MLTLGLDFPKLSSTLLLFLVVLPLSCWMLANDLLAAEQKHFENGLKYYLDGRFDAALHELNEDIALAPKASVSFHARGNVYYEMHDYSKAIEDYNTAIKLKPDDATAYGNRGWSYRRLGRYEQALQDLETCSRMLGLPVPKAFRYSSP